MDKHREAVARIAADVRGFYDRKESFRIYHGATNSTRLSKYQRGRIVDTSGLNNVLKVDQKARTTLLEPSVPMDHLVECTMKYGLVPPVVMEFPGITVGGGFAGTAGESSSFRYGLFDSLIKEIEIVLASGEVVTASETERPDLRAGAAGSCGTLGVITCLEMQLVEAKTYVELTYFPFKKVEDAIYMIKDQTDNTSIDYLDGIIFSLSSTIVMSGRLTDRADPGARIQRFTRAHDEWFYRHVEKRIGRHDGPVTELIPLTDYLFRYDRGAFWGGMHAFKYFMTPFNRITRWALDYFMHTRVMYHALHKSGLANRTIVQDLALPFSRATEFVMYLDSNTTFYPLWLCPVRPSQQVKGQPHRSFSVGKELSLDDTLLNIGVWGMGPKDHNKFVDLNRRLERKVRDLSGLKCLYAHAYYTEEEFWEIYDHGYYDSLRQKYHATSLPTVYDKVKVDLTKQTQQGLSLIQQFLVLFWNIWPLSGIYGALCAAFGGDYLLRAADKK